MENYEALIMGTLSGYSPKDKYEYLKKLEQENLDYIVKLNVTRLLLEGLAGTPDTAELLALRPFIEATYKHIL